MGPSYKSEISETFPAPVSVHGFSAILVACYNKEKADFVANLRIAGQVIGYPSLDQREASLL
jgi:hypothetical protein